MKKIFVATNFSPSSEGALTYGVQLAVQSGAELTLIHAYHLTPFPSDSFESMRLAQLRKMEAEAEAAMLEWLQDNAPIAEFNYRIINQQGLAQEVITDLVEAEKPDLLIMGSRKMSLIDKVVFGSVTGGVMDKVDCPMLVVPERSVGQPFNRIVFASDMHDNDLAIIRFLTDLARPVGGKIEVLHLVNDLEDNSQYESSYFEDFKQEIIEKVSYPEIYFELLNTSNLSETLTEHSQEAGANLLVLSSTQKNWFARLFEPSITRQQFYRITRPTLFFKARDLAPTASE